VSNSVQSYQRWVNNLPEERDAGLPLGRRLLTSRWTWIFLVATIVYTLCLVLFVRAMMADVEVPGGVMQGINWSAIKQSAGLAAPTVVFWILVFVFADRFRPQRPLLWYLALGWGASAAVVISSEINTWAAMQLNVSGDGNPAAAARPAVFIAPFVEEAAKATVLFLMALLVRYRLVSKVSMVALGGLSAAGFAFTENILYYSQVIVYASQTIEVGDAQAALEQTVVLRGFFTCFGHPLFTVMTAIGLAIALRTRSKVVRILAPLAGYLLAAFGHMLFNSQASQEMGPGLLLLYFGVALPLVISVTIYVVRQILAQGRLIYYRLGDYVRVGWLSPTDPEVFSRFRTRFYAGFIALSKGWSTWLATVGLQYAMTELAYLRDAETSGIVDAAAGARAEEILLRVRELRPLAISDPRGMRINWPRLRLPGRRKTATIGDDLSAQITTTGGSAGYSAVDPKWGPPQG
jgi:RsiW-degrading membrane proteinase PrsW (M82 family)